LDEGVVDTLVSGTPVWVSIRRRYRWRLHCHSAADRYQGL